MLFAAELPPTPPAYEYVIQDHNPLLSETSLICFDQIEPHHFLPAYKEALAQAQDRLETLSFDTTMSFSEFIGNLENLETKTDQISHILSLFTGTMDCPELREVTEPFYMLAIDGDIMFYHHPYIVEGLSHFKQAHVYDDLAPHEQRIVDLRYRDLFLAGAFLSQEDKEVFTSYAKELTKHKQAFSQNHNDALTNRFITVYEPSEVKGVPYTLLEEASYNYPGMSSIEQGPWAFSVDHHTTTQLLKLATSESLRKQTFLAKNEIAALSPYHNQEEIEAIVTLRQKISELLGFKDYTEMSLSTKLAPTHHAITTTFSEIEAAAQNAFVYDKKRIEAFAFSLGHLGTLKAWDKTFYTSRLEEALTSFDSEELKSYFSFDHVINTLFTFCGELFDVNIRQAERAGWHEDVTYYTVHNPEGEMIASFFVDPFIRKGQKQPGAWMSALDSHWHAQDGVHLPLTYLATNFKKGMNGEPCLLTFRQITALFHEFGHTLQHLLSKSENKTLSGLSYIEFDSVEIASQFMENWVTYPPLLKRLACHIKTGETLSDEIIEQLYEGNNFMSGWHVLMQLAMGEYDLRLHSASYLEEDKNQLLFDILEEAGFNPHLSERNFPCRFGHLFSGSYAAGYYGYMYANIRSADLFAAFEEANFDPDEVAHLGKLYKQTFLEMGSHLTQDEVFALFRGRAPNTKALIRHLGLVSQ